MNNNSQLAAADFAGACFYAFYSPQKDADEPAETRVFRGEATEARPAGVQILANVWCLSAEFQTAQERAGEQDPYATFQGILAKDGSLIVPIKGGKKTNLRVVGEPIIVDGFNAAPTDPIEAPPRPVFSGKPKLVHSTFKPGS